MEICELKKDDEKAWDEYVLKHPDSTFYHQIGWKHVVEESYGHKPYYLFLRENGKIKGVLPLFFMKSLLFGKKLVSLPFAPYGGAVGEENSIKLLIEEAIKLAKDLGVDYLEMRNATNTSNLLKNSLYATSILLLDQDPKIVWEQRLTRNKRKNVVKSQKRNLSVNFSSEINEFYEIFAINMRDLGSPIHSEVFFNNILKQFPDSAKVQIVSLDSKPIYAAFYLFYQNTIINSWSSSIEEYRNYYPTDFGIWTAIEYGCRNNYKYYDFGRSQEGSPNMEFKERWGAESKILEYQYYLNRASRIPNNTSANSNRQNFAKIWKILPLSITSRLGPIFRKEVG
jgi:FemAB-related protein (PEP-CTERM system-associated)